MGKKNASHKGEPVVLFTEVVTCERVGDIFYAGGRSDNYTRKGAMTADYVRELVAKLSTLLAQYDIERGCEPVMDDLELVPEDGGFRFRLFLGGRLAGAGKVTRGVCEKAKTILDDHFPPPKSNVVRLGAKAHRASAWFAALWPVLAVVV